MLDIECMDRIYLNAYVPNLQSSGAVVTFIYKHLGMPVVSPAVFERRGTMFRQAVARFAENNGIPVVKFAKDVRKLDVMQPYLEEAAREGRSRVAAIGVAQEFQRVREGRKRENAPGKAVTFTFAVAGRRVTCCYFYVWDESFGPGFIKVCSYFPCPAKVWLNGHEWAKRQMTRAGVAFTGLSNGFASCDDPAALQAACDRLGPGHITVFFERWMSRIPLPLAKQDRDGGYWRELSMRQVEVSRTIVFGDPAGARAFFGALIADNIGLGRPENVEMLFARARVKQYLKDGRALRTETVVNSPDDLKVPRRLCNLDELQARARAVNARVLQTERAGQECVFDSPAFARISRPALTGDGRRAPALRFGDPRAQALAGALASTLYAVTGITNKSLRALMTGLPGTPYTVNQASYDLARLARNGLVERVPAPQPVHPHPRRDQVRSLLHQGPRPRPAPAHGRRPPARTTSAAGGTPRHRHRDHPAPRRRKTPGSSLTSTRRTRLKTQDRCPWVSNQERLGRAANAGLWHAGVVPVLHPGFLVIRPDGKGRASERVR